MLFARVNLPLLDKKLATQKIMELEERHWFWDPYRATRMLPLMTKDGQGGSRGAQNNRTSNGFAWLPYTPDVVKQWFDNIVFPWMGQSTRIMALLTQPNSENNEHIDCDPHKMGTMQHKFRVVLHGDTNTLYFKTKQGDVQVPNIDSCFIMDGSWPHGMRNNSNDFKLTLAAGAPWEGKPNYDNVDVLLQKSAYVMPEDFDKYFNKKPR
jgi:hypothetical protein